MQIEEKLEKTLERLGALEHQYDSDKKVVKVGATVFAILLIAFFGISLREIKSKVDEAMEGTIIQTSTDRAQKAAINAEAAAKNAEESQDKAKMKLIELNKMLEKNPSASKFVENKSASKNGYAWIGDIMLVWGTAKSPKGHDTAYQFNFKNKFPNKCFTVIPSMAGEITDLTYEGFKFDRLNSYDGDHYFTYIALGN